MLYTPNNLLYKYIRYRFRRIQIECNMVYDVTPEEEDEICRNLLKKRAKILIPVGILYFLLLLSFIRTLIISHIFTKVSKIFLFLDLIVFFCLNITYKL